MSDKGKTGGSMPEEDFTGWRAILWPVHNFELKKFLPMGLMMLCILFIYRLVRDIKDTLMVSQATGGGAETLGFLKLWGVTPSAILFMIIFVKLANKLSKANLFYTIVSFFLGFFVLFGLVIYPLTEYFHMSYETISNLQTTMPRLYWVWPIIGNWSYAVFYILSELWGSVVLSALFWQFANEITKISEAKRFYSLFGFVGNFGLLASGSIIIICANIAKNSAIDGTIDAFGESLKYQMLAVLFFGLLLLYLYRWMNKNVLTDPKLYTPGAGSKKKSKPKLGLIESTKCILTSRYLLMISALVIGYGISINLVEGVWKGQIKLLYPDPNDFNVLMGKLALTTGFVTIIIMLIGANILRRFSWRTAALITPIFLMVTSVIFFGVIIYENKMGLDATLWGFGVLLLAVVVGLMQNAFSKGVKYSLFDATKQMAYIPLDPELKVKGQAAVEILAGRLGKSGGAAIQSIMLLIIGGNVTLASQVEFLGSAVLVVVAFWIISVFGLSKQFETLKSEQQQAEEANSKENKEVKDGELCTN